jgi:hypothetical protein
VAELAKKFVPIYVSTDNDTTTSGKFGVMQLPDVRFLKSDGTEIAKLGARDAASVAKQMQAALDAAK